MSDAGAVTADPREIDLANRRAVLELLLKFPGITNREIGLRLSLSEMAVGRHVGKIRGEWMTNAQKGVARPKRRKVA
ncbi:winged helix-turn-helix transcriptional regulator [Rhodoblastus acidophilus]|uniref:Winged helix-turn-helix transcriptional regulator n=1 Tax=Rhodoblastus acidophilus TaxID=1074 RepID=A0A6N8DRI3_RHOAC|nr:winged helix-turn-helix domain-containing protein [Rhodoblastus acidophilus]MCW2276362.1 DNA-binding NarL/FixJ family response regulator [Rhodoblastus acidophilus]MTV33017.1 winged helix-turn-helix transcriptional regulator [Rhodoblastus acidophilus]